MTTIWSALCTVERRWATMRVVLPVMAFWMARATMASLSASSAEVASSNSNTRGSIKRARAIATRCFCPPLRRTPRSPTRVP
mmetsp:Transcript_1605/g.5481  ORF Transcript_1605/g.5481 Transcript_1605/m.5481 type:complete len:82 (+) Transcript_1605:352-597(+)